MSLTRIRKTRPSLCRPRVEALEDRVVPTVRLFVDFGDNFGASGLSITNAELTGSFASGGLQGPLGLGVAKMTYTSLGDEIIGTLDYNGDGTRNTADYTDLKRDVLDIVKRVYEPFNLIVEEVASNSVAAIRAKMEANNANPVASGIRDAYVIVGKAVDSGGVSVGGTSLLGIAGVDSKFFFGNTFPQVNDLDNTTLVFADTVIGFTSTSKELATLLAFVVAHEAGHSFTMFHTAYDDLFGLLPPDTGTLVGSEVMIGAYTGTQQNFIPMITRFPLIAGDFNFNPNLVENPYGTLANFARSNIGAKSDPTLIGAGKPNPGPVGPAYVTGTGANDIIRITPTGANTAVVEVEPYRTPRLTGLIDIPGTNANTFTYTINTTGGIIINAGLGDDNIILSGDLGVEVSVRGMGGIDRLTIDGKNTGSVIYTPDGTKLTGFDNQPDRRGQIQVGTTTINFREFELGGRISIENAQTFTFRSPGGSDDLELINSGDAIRVRGKIADGIDFVQATVFNTTTVVLDTGTNDNAAGNVDDVVKLKNILVAKGLTNVVFDTGLGNDVFQLFQGRLDLPGSGGGITFRGGAGNDRLDVLAGEFIPGPDETFTFDGGDGDDVFNFGVAVVPLPRNAALVMDGGNGNDSLILGPATLSNFTFTGGEGNDTLTLLGKLNLPAGAKFSFTGGAGDDTLALGGAITAHKTATFAFEGGDGLDALGSAGTGQNTWAIGNKAITLNNRLRFTTLESVRGGAGPDVFLISPDSKLDGTIDGGGGRDVLNLTAVRNVQLRVALTATAGVDATVALPGGTQMKVANIDHVIAGTGPGDNLFGADTPSHWLLSAAGSRYSSGKSSVTFSGIEGLLGGASDDTLFIDTTPVVNRPVGKPGAAATITLANVISPRQVFDGGAGSDKLQVNGSAAAEAFALGFNTLTILGRVLTLNNTEEAALFGAGGNDVFTLTSAVYAMRRIDVYGDGGADTFNVAPAQSTAIRVFGDTITNAPSGADVLRVLFQGTNLAGLAPAINAPSGRLFFTNGFLPFDFFGMERVERGALTPGGGGKQFRPF
jgi:hypothetical protein